MSIATFDVHDSTRKDISSSIPESVLPSKEHLTEVQVAYGVSCTFYKEKAAKN
jgi:hypothetical protein